VNFVQCAEKLFVLQTTKNRHKRKGSDFPPDLYTQNIIQNANFVSNREQKIAEKGANKPF
jgi:hypothetical protein